MEEILGQKMRPPIKLTNFLEEFRQSFADIITPEGKCNLQNAMSSFDAPEHYQTIAEKCSLEFLSQSDDARVRKFVPGYTEINRKNFTKIPEDVEKLRTFKKLLETKDSSAKNPFLRSREIFKMVQPPTKEEDDETCDFYNDVIVTLRIYRPARSTHVGQSLEKPVFAEEFECLGTNLLTELRDKITCVCNDKHFFDISENPSVELPDKETDPGYFFITDTFYNDKRNRNNADYSETIRTWAKKATGLNNIDFKVAKMEETRFIDLTVSLGFPQLYQHHGNCEHVFVISQVEIITPNAICHFLRQYPRLRSFGLYNKRLCNMCSTRHYVFIVEHSDRQLHDPAYLCSQCFYNFHYVDGKKIGNFKAYRINYKETDTIIDSAYTGVGVTAPDSSTIVSTDVNTIATNDNEVVIPSTSKVAPVMKDTKLGTLSLLQMDEDSFLEESLNNLCDVDQMEFISVKKEKE